MRVLCGELGYRPADFYDLMYCEVCIILAGHAERLQREREDARWGRAWLVSYGELAQRVEKWLKPHELLGESDPDPVEQERERLEEERRAHELLGVPGETPEQVLARFGMLGGADGGQ